MANGYDSLYTGQHNDGYEPRILGLEGISTTFTSQISTLQASTTAIATTANSKVAKAGDTMTGNLNIKANNITLGTTSSDNHYSPGFGFRDSYTSNIGAVRAYSLVNGQQGIYIEAVQSVNGANQYNTLRLGVNAQGDREIFINDATKPAWRKTLGIGNAYGMEKWGTLTLNSSTTSSTKSITLTTNGRPVFLIVNGDINPGAAESTWMRIEFKRDSTVLCSRIVQSNAGSCNNPFTLSYLDVVTEGTYTYTAAFTRGAGTVGLSEEGVLQSPQFIAFEI